MSGDRREDWIDVAKGLGIVLVVYGHAFRGLLARGLVDDGSPLVAIDYAIYTFHMPLFFFLSGLFARRSLARGAAPYWSAKLRQLAYPYLLWSILQLSLQMGFRSVASERASAGELLQLLWAPPEQFWFVYVLFWCFAVFFALRRLGDWQILAIAAGFFSTRYFVDFGVLSTLAWAFLYFALGSALAGSVRQLAISVAAAWVLSSLFLMVVFGALALGRESDAALVASFCGIAAALALSRRLEHRSELLALLGRLSFAIYVMHVMATALIRTALLRFVHLDAVPLQLLAGTVAGLALPALASIVLSRAGLAPWFGLPRAPRRAARASAPIAAEPT